MKVILLGIICELGGISQLIISSMSSEMYFFYMGNALIVTGWILGVVGLFNKKY